MLCIDGSYGEGGGQILRTAIGLSTHLNIPVQIINIRAGRPNPGLRPQHLSAVTIMKQLCNAETEGLSLGSTKVMFTPRTITPKTYIFDITTAGSITLVFQTIILGCLNITKPLTVTLKGGTDVLWAPPWDYFIHVYLPILHRMGLNIEPTLIRRGYYPQGGGEAHITIHPQHTIKPLHLDKQKATSIEGNIHIGHLPDLIASRMKHAAIKTLLKHKYTTSITTEQTTAYSPGVGLTLWTTSPTTRLGATRIGKKGVTSEAIGEQTALTLLHDLQIGATLDTYAFDQLLPYMALATSHGPSSCIVPTLSNHAKTNLWLIQQFLPITSHIEKINKATSITIQ
jgi:RNA 3'-terminal phosphate cyclase (ATP)